MDLLLACYSAKSHDEAETFYIAINQCRPTYEIFLRRRWDEEQALEAQLRERENKPHSQSRQEIDNLTSDNWHKKSMIERERTRAEWQAQSSRELPHPQTISVFEAAYHKLHYHTGGTTIHTTHLKIRARLHRTTKHPAKATIQDVVFKSRIIVNIYHIKSYI